VDRPLTGLHASAATRPGRGRRAAWATLLAGVLLVHALGVYWLRDTLAGWGAGAAPTLHRMDVAFVQALAPAAPPPVAASPAVARPQRTARAPTAARPASAPAAVEAPAEPASAPVTTPPPPPEATAAARPAPVAEEALAASAAGVSAAAPAAPASVPQAAGFEWPPSTRLTYSLVGNYRGDVQGSAVVQWVREGSRYQVHLDVFIGPSFAPLMSRRMTSDGELGPGGLAPQRYEETTKVAFQSPRRATVQFMPGMATLANGSTREVPAAVQDTASQFVQLTWMFTTQPSLLAVGRTVEVPLALPRRTDRWLYDVIAQERLATPVGDVDTFHLKPRRAEQRPRGELSAEVWFAPTLQYLPVRIRIQQDTDTFVDLTMDAAPMQAAPAGPR
jgi:Protein of unknown function (DUF3108)